MKLALWLVNSALLFIACCAFIALLLLRVSVPEYMLHFTIPTPSILSEEMVIQPKIEKIYLNDLFDTYLQKELGKQGLQPLPAVPPSPTPSVIPSPPPETPTFLPPLEITLRGIVLSSQADLSTALIEDETGKEERYHLGEIIKDAQLVKIAYDRIIILRSNGQQDSIFLRTPTTPLAKEAENRWSDTVKKIDDSTYHVDLEMIKLEIPSIGQLLETFAIATAFDQDKPIGLRIGECEENGLAYALGFEPGDLITAIADIPVGPINKRIEAFTKLTQVDNDIAISVQFIRNNQELVHIYKFVTLEKKAMRPLERANVFNLKKGSALSTPKEQARPFEDTARDMRARLLDNMRMGRPDTRNR